MTDSIGRYSRDLVSRQLGGYDDILSDLEAKPRGANGNKDGRSFELAYAAYLIVLQIAEVLNLPKEDPLPVEKLERLAYNDRPICLVDDSHIVGLETEAYAQLKLGDFEWAKIEHDFRRQIDLDQAHGLKVDYRFVLGKPRNVPLLQKRLELRGLSSVTACAFYFPPQYLRRIAINSDLKNALEIVTGTTYPEWRAAAYGVVLAEVEQSRGQFDLINMVRRLHEDRPYLYHPIEERHAYEYLLTLLQQIAPDVDAWICGPTLRLSEDESRESYTIPWGDEEAIDAFAGTLRAYELSAAEEYLKLADVLEILEASGWRRAVPPTRKRTRPYIELGAEA
ncbi:hypothetical protein CO662_21960 [Rhizobium anhuiense]|uniref:Nucleotidyltransferase n=1 Tax=Rhizobium anhuiense TaxID=1184720 RepID=A0ABX4J3G8_9HYPH|nr:hypothetical protein [Rhizobium anhuiense]PDS49740.1 hypothetical protein CO662_21960 [Rhizobium anhuiense]